MVRSARGREIAYDAVVLATGSAPFVPPVPGIDKKGVFVYRTIEDLEQIIAYGLSIRKAAVIGGGLLGLEAAKAAYDLGLETHVVEFAPRLMPRQIDEAGSRVLVGKINALGVQVHLNKNTKEILGNGKVEGMAFADGGELDVKMIVVSAGIKPRDDLARGCGLMVGQRGGVVVDDQLRTSDPDIYAIGEVALYGGMIYGLVAPGYEMAEIAAANLLGQSRTFTGADMSTKLKLMGVDVASFGNCFADDKTAKGITCEDPFKGSYKKLLFNLDGTRLLGGILVGDASEYGMLSMLAKSGEAAGHAAERAAVRQERRGEKRRRRRRFHPQRRPGLLVQQRQQGADLRRHPRQEPHLGRGGQTVHAGRHGLRRLPAARHRPVQGPNQGVRQEGQQRPVRAFRLHATGIVRDHQDQADQDVRRGDRLARPGPGLRNLQAGRRLDPGEPVEREHRRAPNDPGHQRPFPGQHPARRLVLRRAARAGRRDHAGEARRPRPGGEEVRPVHEDHRRPAHRPVRRTVHQLPDIWEELVAAGFESGHAYGKALRTVKSCVGTTWCRYGVQDSVGFAIRVENRYKGIRSPHKIKAAVSGCVRECAEAQSKDFGIIATEKGWNLYVCGNGGAKPRHADLLAADIDEETCIRYIDRFLMYYIQTADRLTRTSVWLEKMEGGLEYLRDVIIHDRLGICDELERQMQYLVDTYQVRMGGGRQRPGEAPPVPAVRQHRRNGADHRVRQAARAAAACRLDHAFHPGERVGRPRLRRAGSRKRPERVGRRRCGDGR